jgi:hypothetical protein
MSGRHWTGEALAAFDQALGQIEGFGTPELWLQRAQVAAQIASAEQARIANLIAWKALRQAASTSPSSLPNAGDAIADEIEASLGIPDAAPDTGVEARAIRAGLYLDLQEANARLARIAALCDGFQADGHGDAVSITAVRAILAEVTPGVTLTPEEAALALGAVHRDFNGEPSQGQRDRLGALAARLEAAS